LSDLLLRPEVRLVTLTGVGGSGKTTLALEAGRHLERAFAGGITFVDLSSVADDDAAACQIAHAVGVRQTEGRSLADALRDHIRRTIRRPTLLILDNVEQLAGIGPLLVALLDGSGALTVLATSRRLLRVRGEFNYPVTPLAVPADSDRASLDILSRVPAVALFVQRAAAIEPSFELSARNAAPVADICIQLDGLPLALELAAARVRVLGVVDLAARMTSRLDLVADAAADAPDRQRTLRATLEWSYAGLDPAQQRLFRRLSVFTGGCTNESVEAVCNTKRDLGVDAIEGLASLLDRSLVRAADSAGGGRRFGMLMTVREFGLEQLEKSGERDAVAYVHAAYCLVIAEEVVVRRSAAELADWLALCEVEHDNLRAALAYLVETGRADWALRLAVGLYRYWEHREHLAEGRAWFEAILRMPAASPRNAARARALNYAASFADHQGDGGVAYERHLEALQICREIADARGEILSLNSLCANRRFHADYAEAVDWGERTLAACRRLGDPSAIAAALSNLGDVVFLGGRPADARRLLEEAWAAFTGIQDMTGMAWTLNHLGDIAAALGEQATALTLYQRAKDLFTRSGDRWGVARSACDLGDLACSASDFDAARRHFREALTTFHELGHRRGVASALEGCARLAADQGDRQRALALAGAAAELRRTTGAVARCQNDRKVDRIRDKAVAGGGSHELKEWWAAGERMTYGNMIDYALDAAGGSGLA
jgi:predicted ATPase